MIYLRSIISIIFAFLLFAIAVPLALVLILFSFGTLQSYVIEHFGKIIGRSVLAAAGIKMNIHQDGKPVRHSVIYTINHSSTLDLLVIIGLGLPRVRFVAKHELQYNPLFFILGNITGQVFINRKKSDKAVASIQKAYNRILRKKLSVLVAPEGSRKHEGTIGPFKKGAFRMAIDLNYPIVPVYVRGASELSQGGSLMTKPGNLDVYIHQPVDTSEWSIETLDEHIEFVRNKYLEWAGHI